MICCERSFCYCVLCGQQLSLCLCSMCTSMKVSLKLVRFAFFACVHPSLHPSPSIFHFFFLLGGRKNFFFIKSYTYNFIILATYSSAHFEIFCFQCFVSLFLSSSAIYFDRFLSVLFLFFVFSVFFPSLSPLLSPKTKFSCFECKFLQPESISTAHCAHTPNGE